MIKFCVINGGSRNFIFKFIKKFSIEYEQTIYNDTGQIHMSKKSEKEKVSLLINNLITVAYLSKGQSFINKIY